ncbi:MAG: hypothetical protein H6821_02125 [Planctomycetaceae bacterium]|nr:hypothetical protein [Planctomycetaceae bacterium]MCB9937539.1 hypothetical protein [Planctomycetaceae bacterium]HRX79122.1 hypothetical protein [Pirellulaceae bacterium]
MQTTILLTALLLFGSDAPDRQSVITVVGAPGTEEYGQQFVEWSNRWQSAATTAGAEFIAIGTQEVEGMSDRDRLQQQLETIARDSTEPLWLVLIGHGTFDGKVAKFNLRGADVTATELATWLTRFNRPVAVINCASSSGPFVNALAGSNRVIVTSTKSGFEQNYSRFGDFISRAIVDTAFDLDKDEQTSLLEAFIAASSRVEEFYKQEGRLATEHALLDDNGDGRGTPADWFRGVRATKSAKGAAVDGQLANRICLVRSEQESMLSAELRAQRDLLSMKIETLRKQKSEILEDAYYSRLEELMITLARLYESAETPDRVHGPDTSIAR